MRFELAVFQFWITAFYIENPSVSLDREESVLSLNIIPDVLHITRLMPISFVSIDYYISL